MIFAQKHLNVTAKVIENKEGEKLPAYFLHRIDHSMIRNTANLLPLRELMNK